MKTQLELKHKDLANQLAEASVAHDEIKDRNDERGQAIDDLNRKCTELVGVPYLHCLSTLLLLCCHLYTYVRVSVCTVSVS